MLAPNFGVLASQGFCVLAPNFGVLGFLGVLVVEAKGLQQQQQQQFTCWCNKSVRT